MNTGTMRADKPVERKAYPQMFRTPTRLGLVDSDWQRQAFLTQVAQTPDLQLMACAVRDGVDAVELFRAAGWAEERLQARSPAAARADGTLYLSRDATAVVGAIGLEVLLLDGSNAASGLARVLLAHELGHAVIEANSACAALVGPLLLQRAQAAQTPYLPDGGSQHGRELQIIAAAEPALIVVGSELAALECAVILANSAQYTPTGSPDLPLLRQNDVTRDLPAGLLRGALNRFLLSAAAHTALAAQLTVVAELREGLLVEAAADAESAARATLSSLRQLQPAAAWLQQRRLELCTLITTDAPADAPLTAEHLQPQLVSAAAADRDGLVPWPIAAQWPLQQPVSAGRLLCWDDLAYQATDPTVRMILLQRRRLPAVEGE